MPKQKPLVLDSIAQLQQLQSPNDLDIPLQDRVERLEQQMAALANLITSELDLPATHIIESV